MIGRNSMMLNEATMQRIVQQWIDKEVATKPVVKSVTKQTEGFKIALENSVGNEQDD